MRNSTNVGLFVKAQTMGDILENGMCAYADRFEIT